MKEFLNDDFLLDSETARILYHQYAKKMPIYDYHCHLPIKEIYEDRKFDSITDLWLVEGHFGDHYKWRAMRNNGVSEEFIGLVQKQVIDWLYYHIKTFDRSVAEYRFIRENPDRL